MKRAIISIAIIFSCFPILTRAEEVNLGNFSIDEIQKIVGAPFNFHLKEKTIVADKNAFSDWLKIRPTLSVSPKYMSERENINFFPTDEPGARIYFRFIEREQDRFHIRISTRIIIDEEQLKNYLEKTKEDSRVPAENA